MQTNSNKPNWALHFNIDDETYAKLDAKAAQRKCTTLDLALDTGLINENTAMSWFRDKSGMPSLKDVFFNAQAPTHLWQDEHFQSCRAAACLPVAQWEGVIYWAKLSNLPTGFEISHPGAIWVLAPWSGMKRWFEAWKATLPAEEQKVIEESTAEKAEPKPGEPAANDFAAPIGLSANATSENLNIDFSSISVDDGSSSDASDGKHANVASVPEENHVVPPTPTNDDGELLIDLNLSGEDSPSVQTVSRMAPAPVLNPVPAAAAPMAPTPVPPTIKPMAAPLHAPPMPPIPSANFGMPPATPTLKPVAVVPQMPPPPRAAAAAPTAPPVTATAALIPTITIDQIQSFMASATTQEALANVLMAGWQNYFKQILILLFQQDHLILWWNNNRWPGNFERGEPIVLDTPSIFKIVADTAQPYHGHVCSGPINDEFFRKVNNGNYPDHVTIVPVKAEDRVVAMLLGTCDQDEGKRIPLDRLETQAAQFSEALVKLMAPKQQAS